MIGKDGWFSLENLVSHSPSKITFIVISGGRGIGKTNTLQKYVIFNSLYHPDDEFSWLRMNPKALSECMSGFPDQVTRNKIKSNVKVERKKFLINGKIKGHFFALSQAHNIRSNSVNWRKQRFVVFDEFNQEPTERKNFDVVDAFLSVVESITRIGSSRIKAIEAGEKVKPLTIFFLGNDTMEVGPVLERFGFVPTKPGRYILPAKKLLVEYVEDSPEWESIRKKSPLSVLRQKSDRTLGDVNKARETKVDVDSFGKLENPIFFCRLWYSLNEAVTVFRHRRGLFITNQFDSAQANRLAGLGYRAYVAKTKDLRKGRYYDREIIQAIKTHIEVGKCQFNNQMIGRIVTLALSTSTK